MNRGWRLGVLAALVGAAACEVPTAPPRFETTFVVPAEKVTVPVTSQNASASTTYDLTDTGDLAGRARGGALVVDVANASDATGTVRVRISGGGATVEGDVNVAAGNGQRIAATREQMQALLGGTVTITASGTLCPRTGCALLTFPPFPSVTFDTRLELVLEIGGES